MSHAVALVTDDRNRVQAQCRCTWRLPWITPPMRIPALLDRRLPSGSLPGICTNHRQPQRLRCSDRFPAQTRRRT